MAGSEQQGIEYARDDLLVNALTLITRLRATPDQAVDRVAAFWQCLGCRTHVVTPNTHDRMVAAVSHVPHATATALVNATRFDSLAYAGKGFLDTSRVASGPANVWGDILLTNPGHITRGIERVIKELEKLKQAIGNGQRPRVERLLTQGRDRRAALIEAMLKKKELLK